MTVEQWLGNDNKIGIDIWNKKYRYKDESLDQWFDRISGGDKELRQLLVEKKFMFGGRALAGRGTEKHTSYSNCYSSGYAPDSVEGMLELNKNIALTYKSGGGQGISLTHIRPKGADIKGGEFKSDGIVPFMELFNQTTESISQGGGRKGALMMSLSIWHPEIETFISIKDGSGRITKANLSVEIDDCFMELVAKGVTEFKYNAFDKQHTINPVELYKKIMGKAWSSAEPGIIFTDMFRTYNLMEHHSSYNIITGNPCGEQSLPKDGACCLGAISLDKFVVNPFKQDAYVDLTELRRVVRISVRALNDILDEGLPFHALKNQRDMAEKFRNIGLGFMGLSTMFMMMGIKYGEEESINLASSIAFTMFEEAVLTSSILAKDNGVYPGFEKATLESRIYKGLTKHTREYIKTHGLRNCSLLTVAPTGSIGTMLGVSTGIEPYYAVEFTRKTESLNGEDKYYTQTIDIAKKAREAFGDDAVVTAMDVNWRDRIDLQSGVQKFIDTAISSTVNLKEETTLNEIMELYMYAWKKKLKGITIYREGSFDAILSTGKKKVANSKELARGEMKKVADDTIYIPKKLQIGCGRIKLMVGYSPLEKTIQDLYVIKSGSGGCEKNIQAVAIYMSGILRLGGDIATLEKAISGVGGCTAFARGSGVCKGGNCPNALLVALKEVNTILFPVKDEVKNNKQKCPECGEHSIAFEGGCMTCNSCGFSKCG